MGLIVGVRFFNNLGMLHVLVMGIAFLAVVVTIIWLMSLTDISQRQARYSLPKHPHIKAARTRKRLYPRILP